MRDWDSPEYRKWRARVRRRDGRRCRMPGCNARTGLQVHHIRKWSDHLALRFADDNGITLCRSCHDKVRDNEEAYEALFRSLISHRTKVALCEVIKKRYEVPGNP